MSPQVLPEHDSRNVDPCGTGQDAANQADITTCGTAHFLGQELVQEVVKEVVEDMVEKSRVSDDNTAEPVHAVQSAAATTLAVQSTRAVENTAALLQHSTLWLQQQCSGSHQADYQRFWQFSLAMYPNWQQPLLTLQDQYQARVNLLLLLAFVARPQTDAATPDTASHRHSEPPAPRSVAEPLTASQLNHYLVMLQSATEPTQQQLLPLRAQRRLLDKAKPEEALLRQQLLALELAIEQQEQQRLIDAWLEVSRLYLADKPALGSCDAMPQPYPLALCGRSLLDYYLTQLQLPNSSEIQQLLLD